LVVTEAMSALRECVDVIGADKLEDVVPDFSKDGTRVLKLLVKLKVERGRSREEVLEGGVSVRESTGFSWKPDIKSAAQIEGLGTD
jgi:hypothetical protein